MKCVNENGYLQKIFNFGVCIKGEIVLRGKKKGCLKEKHIG